MLDVFINNERKESTERDLTAYLHSIYHYLAGLPELVAQAKLKESRVVIAFVRLYGISYMYSLSQSKI